MLSPHPQFLKAYFWCVSVRYVVEDFGESFGNNLCTVVALFNLYQLAFMYWVLVTLSVEVSACTVRVARITWP